MLKPNDLVSHTIEKVKNTEIPEMQLIVNEPVPEHRLWFSKIYGTLRNNRLAVLAVLVGLSGWVLFR